MAIDLLLFAFALLLGAWGAFTGPERQLRSWAALLAAFVLASVLGPRLGALLPPLMGWRTYLGPVAGNFVVLLLSYAVLQGLLQVHAHFHPSDALLGAALHRRMWGFSVSALHGLVLGFAALSCLTPADHELALLGRRLHVTPEDALSVRLAQRENAFELTHSLLPAFHGSSQAAFMGENHPSGNGSGHLSASGAAGGLMDASDYDTGASVGSSTVKPHR